MKIVKSIFFSVMALVMAGCLGILICALSPSLTNMLAEKVGNAQAAPGGADADGLLRVWTQGG